MPCRDGDSQPRPIPLAGRPDTGRRQWPIPGTTRHIDHKEHLTANAARLIGFHLHDVSAQGQDHQAIGKGHIDFKMVSSFWKPEHRLVIELSPRVSVDDVRASKERVEALVSNLG